MADRNRRGQLRELLNEIRTNLSEVRERNGNIDSALQGQLNEIVNIARLASDKDQVDVTDVENLISRMKYVAHVIKHRSVARQIQVIRRIFFEWQGEGVISNYMDHVFSTALADPIPGSPQSTFLTQITRDGRGKTELQNLLNSIVKFMTKVYEVYQKDDVQSHKENYQYAWRLGIMKLTAFTKAMLYAQAARQKASKDYLTLPNNLDDVDDVVDQWLHVSLNYTSDAIQGGVDVTDKERFQTAVNWIVRRQLMRRLKESLEIITLESNEEFNDVPWNVVEVGDSEVGELEVGELEVGELEVGELEVGDTVDGLPLDEDMGKQLQFQIAWGELQTESEKSENYFIDILNVMLDSVMNPVMRENPKWKRIHSESTLLSAFLKDTDNWKLWNHSRAKLFPSVGNAKKKFTENVLMQRLKNAKES
jgi:hypothetical protein